MNKKVLAYEFLGVLFIIFFGSLLHFTFELSGYNPVVGVFSAVNESIWEHLKLAFWPTLLFALIEYSLIVDDANNFVLAKTVGVYAMVAVIPAIVYGYTALAGESILAVDIASFVTAVVIGQLASYKLLKCRDFAGRATWVALAFLVALLIVFIVFTFYPPHYPIFQDPTTGRYGIA